MNEIVREANAEAKEAEYRLLRRLSAAEKIDKLTKTVSIRKIDGLRDYFKQLPRHIWAEVLELRAAADKRAERMLTALADPAHTGTSAVKIAAKSGVEIYELTEWVKTWYYHLDTLRRAEEVFYVIRDIAKDALNREEACDKCEGSGRVGENKESDCRKCRGTGVIVVHGDRHARRQLLEMQGLVSGPRNAVQVNVNTPSVPSTIDDILARVNAAQYESEMRRQRYQSQQQQIEGAAEDSGVVDAETEPVQ